jgi:hypothetical protein
MNADQLKGEFMYLTLHMGNPGYLSEVPNYKIESKDDEDIRLVWRRTIVNCYVR